LSYRKPELLRIKQRNAEKIAPLIEAGSIAFLGGTTVTAIQPDTVVLEGPAGPILLPNDEVFVLAGGIPPFAFLRETGIRFGGEQDDSVAMAGKGQLTG
jgi:hypothetical protein